jgi:hypothetical protein
MIVRESISFKRGKDPKRTMEVGKYSNPKAVLLEEIHEYIKNDGWPGWEDVWSIEWQRKEPTFAALAKKDKGLNRGMYKKYVFYLTKDKGVLLFLEAYNGKNLEMLFDQTEYHIRDFKHFISILQSNHTIRMTPVHNPGF